jgi:hypothetical protein
MEGCVLVIGAGSMRLYMGGCCMKTGIWDPPRQSYRGVRPNPRELKLQRFVYYIDNYFLSDIPTGGLFVCGERDYLEAFIKYTSPKNILRIYGLCVTDYGGENGYNQAMSHPERHLRC